MTFYQSDEEIQAGDDELRWQREAEAKRRVGFNSMGALDVGHDDSDRDPPTCDLCGEELQWEDCASCDGEGAITAHWDEVWYGVEEECDNCGGSGGGWYCENHAAHHKTE